MNIAICDDDTSVIGFLEDIVHECFGQNEKSYTCDAFMSGESLLKYMASSEAVYQIYLLDIEMKEINGFTAAARIRENDPEAVIIFITSHDELVMEAFEVVAFHFLVKPLDPDKTKQVLQKAVSTIKVRQAVFQFQSERTMITLRYSDIIYFESNKRKFIIHTKTEKYEFYATMRELLAQINPGQFVQIHNSFVVNMDYVSTVRGHEIILDQGECLNMTPKFLEIFNQRYKNYVQARMW